MDRLRAKAPVQRESDLHKSVRKWLSIHFTPNDMTVLKLSTLGMYGAAGFPDLMLLFPSGRVLFIELKTAVGKVTAIQELRHEQLRGLGFQVEVCRSLDEVKQVVVNFIGGKLR